MTIVYAAIVCLSVLVIAIVRKHDTVEDRRWREWLEKDTQV